MNHRDRVFLEARRLYAKGWGVHWIKPMSKAPVESGWANGKRQPWEQLEKTYKPDYGLGVRLGEASHIGEWFLANIDVDIKSDKKEHQREALAELERRYPGIKKSPCVKTGYGFRFFVLTRNPLTSKKLTQSPETCKVYMPTSELNRRQELYVKEGRISEAELNAGYRIRPAWELEIMSDKRQVVLPPSIHPDTKKAYRWLEKNGKADDESAMYKITGDDAKSGKPKKPLSDIVKAETPNGWAAVREDDKRFTARARAMLQCDGVDDRSAACLSVAMSMLSSGFTDFEVVSVLTDKSFPLGETAFDHRKTKERKNAAAWVSSYVIPKAKTETAAAGEFSEIVNVAEFLDGETKLDPKAAEKQSAGLTSESWVVKLKRSGKDGDGPPKPSMENTVLIIKNAISASAFRLDESSGMIRVGAKLPFEDSTELYRCISDFDVVRLKGWIARKFGYEASTNTIWDAVNEVAASTAYNPLKDDLESLPDWDGKPRIATWLAKYFEAEGPEEYLKQVFEKWLVASVTRVYEPGAKVDWMLVLEGVQGGGKSTFGASLFGQKYFVDYLPNLNDKDAALTLRGMRCVEFSELSSLHRSEIHTVKAFITRQVDKVRPPYGRATLEIPRVCVFFGTTNDAEFLSDKTGNRRFIPVKVGRLNFRALARDRAQLWAEALHHYRMGLTGTLYLEGEAAEHAVKAQNEKMVHSMVDDMANIFAAFYRKETKKKKDGFNFDRFKLHDLFGDFGPFIGFKHDDRALKNAVDAMRIFCKGERLHVYKRGIRGRIFWRIEKLMPIKKRY